MKTEILILAMMLLTFPFCLASGQGLSADDIMQRVNDNFNQQYIKARVKMTITTSSGQKRDFIYNSYSRDKGDKNLIEYLSPARVRGQTILMLNKADDIWTYFPRTDRVRKLATHAKKRKMEGSDFSYEDMGSGEAWITDFQAKLLKPEEFEGHDCYLVELTRKRGAESGYSRLVMWVEKDNFVPLKVDYYDEDDPQLHRKRLLCREIKEVEGVPTPMKAVMIDMEDNSDTVIEYQEITYKVELPEELFTTRGMKR